MTTIHVLNHGGGLNSPVMQYLCMNRPDKYPCDLMIIADLQSERIRTYVALQYYRELAEKYGIEFVVLDTVKWAGFNKTIFDYYFDKQQIQSRMKKDCSAKFKKRAIRRYLRARYGKDVHFVQYLGYAKDEAHRVRDSDVKYITERYPLIEQNLTRIDCINFLHRRGLPIPKKSGCYFCMLQPKRSWLETQRECPTMIDNSITFEENSKRFPQDTLYPTKTLREIVAKARENMSLDDVQDDVDYDIEMEACGGSSCFT